jgi:hypothetical protein
LRFWKFVVPMSNASFVCMFIFNVSMFLFMASMSFENLLFVYHVYVFMCLCLMYFEFDV